MNLIKPEIWKLKHSGVLWLAIVGTLTTNVMLLVLFVYFGNDKSISEFLNVDPTYDWSVWVDFHYKGTTPMLLPMFIVILCALSIAQETRANTWKQLYTLPVKKSSIYLNKHFTVVLVFASAHLLFVMVMLIGPFIMNLDMSGQFPLVEVINLYLLTVGASLGIIGLVYLVSYYFNSFVFPLALGIIGFVFAQLLSDYQVDAWWLPFSYPNESINQMLSEKVISLSTIINSLIFWTLTTILGATLASKRKFRS